MKNFFTLICILVTSITLVFGQGAEGFNRFQEKSYEFISGTFVGTNGINWNYTQCKNYASLAGIGLGKPGLVLKNDTTSEIISSVISGGIGLLKIDYTTFSQTPVKLDVFVNRVKVTTLNSPSSENVVNLSSNDIHVNLDKPFAIRIKQTDETSGQVIIKKVLWSKYSSTDYGVLYDDNVPVYASTSSQNSLLQLENTSTMYQVFPNPAKEYVLIEMSENHNVLFKLFTLTGQMVLQEQVKGSGQKINILNLKEGLYIYKILDDKGKLITGKLIIK